MNKIIFLIAFLSINTSVLSSDQIKAAQELYFFGTSSAKIEALGRSGSVVSDGIFSVPHNPSLFPRSEKFSASFSFYGPYDKYNDANYMFAGVGVSIRSYLSVSAITSSFDIGEEIEILDDNSVPTAFYTPSGSKHVMAFSLKPGKFFSMGASGNFYELNSHDGTSEKKHTAFGLDIGINSIINISKSPRMRQRTCFAITAKNIYGKKLSDTELPNVLTAGLDYSLIPEMHNPFSSTIWPLIIAFTGEFGHSINIEHSKLSGGVETLFFETFALRCGYYSMAIENENIKKFTYGIGLNIPLYRYKKTNLPLSVNFSYSNLSGIERSDDSNNVENHLNYSLTVSWMRRRD